MLGSGVEGCAMNRNSVCGYSRFARAITRKFLCVRAISVERMKSPSVFMEPMSTAG